MTSGGNLNPATLSRATGRTGSHGDVSPLQPRSTTAQARTARFGARFALNATEPLSDTHTFGHVPCCATSGQKRWTRPRNVAGHGTSGAWREDPQLPPAASWARCAWTADPAEFVVLGE